MGEWVKYPIFIKFEHKYGSRKAQQIFDSLERWYSPRGGFNRFSYDWFKIQLEDIRDDGIKAKIITEFMSEDEIMEAFREKAELLEKHKIR
ncbi:MAG: hypothetical protein NTY20_05290 [Candidatus Aenigmarchaeota archaeon]|nr:hypothetical protein [Candidatus Aenigmarchaeota archaeon]